jgi:hypothetical protein
LAFLFFSPHGPHDPHGFFKIAGRKFYVGHVGHVGEKIKKGREAVKGEL